MMSMSPLHGIRWAVRGVLLLGVAASVTANILHARHNPISQTIAAWPPLAFLITVELIVRVPVHQVLTAIARLAATAIIAGIAAWVSYWHMVGVVSRYGETGVAPYLMPFSVDGLIVVASLSLIELAGRIRATVATSAVPVDVARSDRVGDQTDHLPLLVGSGRHSDDHEPGTNPAPVEQPEPVADDVPDERSPKPTAATPKIARVRRRNPAASKTEVATKAGVSLATVRRQWPITEPAGVEPVNGNTPKLEGVPS